MFKVEKEFNVGPITKDYPAMKFLNLIDKDNIERYNNNMKGGVTEKDGVKTFK